MLMGKECRPAQPRSRVSDVTAPVRPDCSAKSCIRETESGNTITFTLAAQQWMMAFDREHSLIHSAPGEEHCGTESCSLLVRTVQKKHGKTHLIEGLARWSGALDNTLHLFNNPLYNNNMLKMWEIFNSKGFFLSMYLGVIRDKKNIA